MLSIDRVTFPSLPDAGLAKLQKTYIFTEIAVQAEPFLKDFGFVTRCIQALQNALETLRTISFYYILTLG